MSIYQAKRRVINQLYPTILDNCGFVAAIEWQVNEFRKNSGITIDLIMPIEPIILGPSYALAAYRFTQECLTNFAKHAGASEVNVELKTCDSYLDLIIRDNGKGMPDEISLNRHGVFGMIERARYLGGSMEIATPEGKGKTAHLRLPLFSH